MQLSKIKMAGFKSFVDPTSIHLPSNLVGIVGPNGCGKSNVIDAVRWVMGESSAKQLRGDSMADVIFNGSSARKPVGTASIELVFDNSDGAIGGQYGNYTEISVRREVVRDGTSNYFLNGTRCRRRDIQDLFLGTGLGPRSYAIIEQGTISRLVESKPDELRMFLEEAAGISKYKERRRETENRIHHTKENIERLNDLLEEINKQIQHLQRQARSAEKYKDLSEEKRRVEAELKALHWRELDGQVGSQDQVIKERETRFEAAVAEQRAVESRLEKSRQDHDQTNDAFSAVQGRYYELGTAIARLEQALQHARELRKRQQTDLEELERNWHEIEGHIGRDQGQINEVNVALAELEPGFARADAARQQSAGALTAAEQSMQDWQARWEEYHRAASDKTREADVGRARIEHLERQLSQGLQRRDKLQQERGGLSADALQREISDLGNAVRAAETLQQRLQTELAEIASGITAGREEERQLARELHTLRSKLEDQRGRLASLEALQQAALGKSRAQVSEWLKQKRLAGNARLAELVSVAPGWERAVETVLGYHLEAVCLDEFGDLDEVASLNGGSLSFVEKASSSPTTAAADSLLAKIKSPVPLHELLGQVQTAEDLSAALMLRPRLANGASVITRDGIWLGRHWVRVVREQDERAGVMAREQELKQLKSEIAAGERAATECSSRQDANRRRVQDLEARREELQAEINRSHRQHADALARQKSGEARLQQVTQRIGALGEESGELQQQLEAAGAELKSVRGELEKALHGMQRLQIQRELLEKEREQLRAQLEQTRAAAGTDAEAAHEIALKLESRRSLLESTEQNLVRMCSQLAQMQARRTELTRATAAAVEPMQRQEAELASLLTRRSAMDAELTEARQGVETATERVRELEQQRLASERQAQALRDEVQQLRLGSQEIRVRRQTLVEQLQHDGYELEAVLRTLVVEANTEAWSQRFTELEQRIARLGPINLAAIQEYAEQSERKQYLDKQLADLNEALDTLQAAIHKIDRETRTRFKETFDRVNTGLQASFPKLFGGGHAYLELTGEELLDTGVAIMARPPGKRNSTIHLLSGGEKALTAVALVFSIFELNPAPFCMLDEVDAPLDEANIGRFCDLVRSMSDRVQFIFITHNKATMEMANQLIGVTMNEPGVSRLVAVDVDEAVRIAAM